MTNTAAETTKAAILNPCLCSQFEMVVREFELENGQPEIETATTGCSSTTAREFAAGHDASLKSLLIRAGIAGLEVRQQLGGVVHSGDALTMAKQFAFAWMVQAGIERGRAKAAAKAEKKAARKAPRAKSDKPAVEMPRKVGAHVVAKMEAPAVLRELLTLDAPVAEQLPATPATTEIRVGRWSYSAVIDAAGDAHYVTAKGAAAVAVAGTYKTA